MMRELSKMKPKRSTANTEDRHYIGQFGEMGRISRGLDRGFGSPSGLQVNKKVGRRGRSRWRWTQKC